MPEVDRAQLTDVSGSETAREILRVAARLFSGKGFDATSVREVVEAAGVTKPTLYYHFGSKEGLAQALLTRPMHRLIDEIRAGLDRPGEPIRHLAEQIESHFAFCREEPDRARFVYGLFFGPNAPGLSAEVAVYGGRLNELLNEAVRGLVRAGIVPEDRARRCAAAVQGLITFYTADYLYQGANLEAGLARRLVEDVLLGFAAGRSPAPVSGAEGDGPSRDP
ncbi:TetR/AcrR family transcriptional regulator [Tautonia plasticadhaerens]|uniref:HTH-type transcriptional regulator AcrR n=1 Tax=Tautonia plasticadhaerens TaxID=2527974 RepID=A0A518GY49_9BACT|nr:TetR/AcrR family transcriptional regulator [Tautonia plasticadhaerens]QDV33524.1 HTH-type transcriptional regulator AcrR [Tautonia plasticadhaerens]